MKKKSAFFLLLLFLDMATKFLTFRFVPKMSWADTAYPFGGIGIFHKFLGGISLSINRIDNLGAAWGMFASHSEKLLFFRILIVLGLFIYASFFNRSFSKGICLFLILTGAVGNILDHFFYGSVIDMIHCNFWGYTFPVFNLADCFISIGIGSLILLSFVEKKRVKAAA